MKKVNKDGILFKIPYIGKKLQVKEDVVNFKHYLLINSNNLRLEDMYDYLATNGIYKMAIRSDVQYLGKGKIAITNRKQFKNMLQGILLGKPITLNTGFKIAETDYYKFSKAFKNEDELVDFLWLVEEFVYKTTGANVGLKMSWLNEGFDVSSTVEELKVRDMYCRLYNSLEKLNGLNSVQQKVVLLKLKGLFSSYVEATNSVKVLVASNKFPKEVYNYFEDVVYKIEETVVKSLEDASKVVTEDALNIATEETKKLKVALKESQTRYEEFIKKVG